MTDDERTRRMCEQMPHHMIGGSGAEPNDWFDALPVEWQRAESFDWDAFSTACDAALEELARQRDVARALTYDRQHFR